MNNPSSTRVASPQQTGVLPLILLFALGLGFGVSFTLNKLATTNGVPFIPYVFWQSAGAAALLVVAAAALRQLPALTAAHIRIYVVMALLNVAIPYLVLSYVAPKLPAGLLPIGLALVPGVIYLMALALRQERFGLLRFAGICLGLVGVLVILLPKASLPEPGMVGWLALSLVATLAFSLRAVLVPLMRPPATTSLSLACGLLIAATIIMLVIMAASGQWWAFEGEFGIGQGATVAGMFNNALILVLIFTVIRMSGPVFFGAVNYISMLIGVAIGMLVFDEQNSLWVWLAMALVLVGLYLVNRGKAR